MGYPTVESSHQLAKITKTLLKEKTIKTSVYFKRPSAETNELFIVVVSVTLQNGFKIKGSANAPTLTSAFTKALIEMGEVYILKSQGFKDRSGIAGGLFSKSITTRAQAELLERDAFLFHYRNKISFEKSDQFAHPFWTKEYIVVFRLMSASNRFHSFLATDSKCADGNHQCLLLGLGAHTDIESAKNKAIGEYATMLMDHRQRPDWCKRLALDPGLSTRQPDHHHAHSRDPRNISLFKDLCSGSLPGTRRTQQLNWTNQSLESPLRFFRYLKADCPELLKLEFGKPEPQQGQEEQPLFHPIW